MGVTPVVSVGDRVKVESMGNYHVQELFDAGNNPNIWGYMPMKVQSIDDMKYFVDKVLEERARERISFYHLQ